MADDKKRLRGRSPLTMYRGNNGPGGYIYRGSVVDPELVEDADRDRLVAEGHLEWVVPDGEGWKLAADTDTGKAGDPVTVGDPGSVDSPELDNGTVNTEAGKPDLGDAEVEQKRAAARARLAEMGGTPDGRASFDVWVEYAVSRGMSREEVEKSSKDELRRALAGGRG